MTIKNNGVIMNSQIIIITLLQWVIMIKSSIIKKILVGSVLSQANKDRQ